MKPLTYSEAAACHEIDIGALSDDEFWDLLNVFARVDEAATASVYFMLCDSPGQQIKIGFATDPESRLAGAQTNCPYRLRLIATFRAGDYRGAEMMLHERFKRAHIHGEWFRSVPEIFEFIERIHKASEQ